MTNRAFPHPAYRPKTIYPLATAPHHTHLLTNDHQKARTSMHAARITGRCGALGSAISVGVRRVWKRRAYILYEVVDCEIQTFYIADF